ncbi:MAG: hypothetical protein HXX08_24825 [Chloroflexi bacterium]|uniref:Uncharacterized protein n=1 Tax=Candidatus Chlorohelix allophototropha TaxID=3003348 RepID=A0A8T7MAD7_9CHLR|nr:hypothetical protein [Chloroflexota bacterium]WJW69023.1 hypothetical protein OZ401_002614 [Chloroflexota bacterium L227-S17]
MLDCEEKRQADRANLRLLLRDQPDWNHSQLAFAINRSLSWIKKWCNRLKKAPSDDPSVLISLKRGRKSPFPPPNPLLVERILEIRDHPPDNLKRTPGPKAISYYLAKDKVLAENGVKHFPLPAPSGKSWLNSPELSISHPHPPSQLLVLSR